VNPFLFFGLAFKASLFSSGGFGNIPSLHADLIARGFATDKTFAEAVAVGQVSPGPNGLWVLSLGYLVGGIWGALAALVAVTLPPLLVLLVRSLYGRIQHHPFVEGFMRGLTLAVVGIFVVVLWRLMNVAGISPRTVLIFGGAMVLGFWGRVPVIVVLALAAVAGMA
jgi:chromate transporter